MESTKLTVGVLIDQGPEYVRAFADRDHSPGELAPEFSWLLLAEAAGLKVSQHRTANPRLADRWAEVAAILYEGLTRGCRPKDELARDIWTRAAENYRTQAAARSLPRPSEPIQNPLPISS